MNPEDFESRFTTIAAGFVCDELPSKMIDLFIEQVKTGDPFGKEKDMKIEEPAVQKENNAEMAPNTA